MNATTALQTITGTHACACGGYTAFDIAGTKRTTGCKAVTKRTFAPGHDARLKGFLIRAGREGLLISTPEGETKDAMQVADKFGFGHMVREGIARKAAPRKAKKATPAPLLVTAKVGRWVYEGKLADGTFTYTDKQGNARTAAKFTVLG